MTKQEEEKIARSVGALLAQFIVWRILRRANAPKWVIYLELANLGRAAAIREDIRELKQNG